MRVPCIVWWPGTVPAGATCAEVTTMMDWLPTLAHLAGGEAPTDRVIDGKDILPLLEGVEGAKTPHEAFYYYHATDLEAVRSGDWKLYVGEEEKEERLFDVRADPGETRNRVEEEPEAVARLKELAEAARIDLGSGEQAGENTRPVGRFEEPVARVKE